MIAYISTEQTITVVLDGSNRTIQVKSKAHRNDVIKALEKFKKSKQTKKDREALEAFLTPIKRVALESDKRFEYDSDDNKLFMTGTTVAIPSTLADKILDFIDNGLPVDPLVKFWESCLQNPHFIAITELFQFLERNNLPITDDGGFLGYKKLNFVNRLDVPDDFEELFIDSKGEVKNVKGSKVSAALKASYLRFVNESNNPTMVDVHSGTIKQKLGEIVRIERVKLGELERRNACGYGLHIGSFKYSFSGNVRVLCKVMPEDVIACNPNEDKLRTCKYKIVSFVDSAKEVTELLVNLSKETTDLINDEPEEDFENPFNEGDIIVSEVTDEDRIEGRYYYVVSVDAESVLIINEQGEEEWYGFEEFKSR